MNRAALSRLESKLAPPPERKPCGPILLCNSEGVCKCNGQTFPTLEAARAAHPAQAYSTPPIFLHTRVVTREELEAHRAEQRKAAS